MNRRHFLTTALFAAPAAGLAQQRPQFRIAPATGQLILGIAEGWNSSSVTLQRYVRAQQGWAPAGAGWNGRLGAAGLVWGRGVSPVPPGAVLKAEGDKRAPAGVFLLGGAYGYDREIQRQRTQSYRQITARDLWVEDVKSPHYNRHLVLDREPRTEWEKKAQMKQGDPAHSLKLFIAHNAPPQAVPGAGSAIFFHIWRAGGSKPSSGCTTMAEANLRALLAWLDPAQTPVYVLLPRAEYLRLRQPWGLP